MLCKHKKSIHSAYNIVYKNIIKKDTYFPYLLYEKKSIFKRPYPLNKNSYRNKLKRVLKLKFTFSHNLNEGKELYTDTHNVTDEKRKKTKESNLVGKIDWR